MFTPAEKFWLDWHSTHSPAPHDTQARLLLLSAAGARPESLAASLGLPLGDVTLTLDDYAARGLDAFPRPTFTPDELLTVARADVAHARQTVDAALTLFDSTANLHHLPVSLRRVLETAALLHEIGAQIDSPHRHLAARELLLHPTLADFSDTHQHLLADVIGLHRKKLEPETVPLLATASPVRQRQTLVLAALLRIAINLDASLTQTTQLHGVVVTPEGVTLRLSGTHAKEDGARARKHAALWRKVFHLPLSTAPLTEPPPDLPSLAALDLTPATPIVGVTRRAIALHMLRWQANETPALEGDAQAIKALRVSARRWRQALKLFGDHFKNKPLKRLRKIAREGERVFGQLRDWDALLTHARAYQAQRPQRNDELVALLSAWEKERAAAAAAVKKWLGGPRNADLQLALNNFLSAPPARDEVTLREAAPDLLHAAVAAVAPAQAALSDNQPRSYHNLRLAFKQLRYALEFLAPALSPNAPMLIEDLVKMQDRLGELSDTYVLQQRLDDYLDVWAEKQAKRKAPQLHGASAVLEYLRVARESWTEQVRGLATDWPPVRAARVKQRVNALITTLKREA